MQFKQLAELEEQHFVHNLEQCMFYVQPYDFCYYECGSMDRRPTFVPPMTIRYAGFEFRNSDPLHEPLQTWLFEWVKQTHAKLLYFVNGTKAQQHILDLQKELIEQAARQCVHTKIQIRMKNLPEHMIREPDDLRKISAGPVSKTIINTQQEFHGRQNQS